MKKNNSNCFLRIVALSLSLWLLSSCSKEKDVLPTKEEVKTTADFEHLLLPAQGYWNGSDGAGMFRSGGIIFPNSYNNEWGSWSKFAYSGKKDDATEGFSNQYASYAGGGAENSMIYAVAYSSGNTITFEDSLRGRRPESVQLTNATYAGLAMKNGDAFSKKFAQGDYFRLLLTGIAPSGATTQTLVFYLADFRDTDASKHYIVKEWRKLDLTALGVVKQIRFELESSDVGDWGMNTPAYFCIDNLVSAEVK